MGLSPYERETWDSIHSGEEGHVETKAEIQVTFLQAKGRHRSPVPPHSPQGDTAPTPTPRAAGLVSAARGRAACGASPQPSPPLGCCAWKVPGEPCCLWGHWEDLTGPVASRLSLNV